MTGGMNGGEPCVAGGHAWQGGVCVAGVCVCMAGRACMAGGMCGRGACMAGVCVVGGMCDGGMCVRGVHGGGVHGRKNGNCRGRYASYWNPFLLPMISITILL